MQLIIERNLGVFTLKIWVDAAIRGRQCEFTLKNMGRYSDVK